MVRCMRGLLVCFWSFVREVRLKLNLDCVWYLIRACLMQSLERTLSKKCLVSTI